MINKSNLDHFILSLHLHHFRHRYQTHHRRRPCSRGPSFITGPYPRQAHLVGSCLPELNH